MKKILLVTALFCGTVCAQNNGVARTGHVNDVFDSYEQPDVSLPVYFEPSTTTPVTPDSKGFIRRWTLLEPISKPELRSNSVFTDSFLKAEFAKVYFKNQMTVVPKDGDKVVVMLPKPVAMRPQGGPGMNMQPAAQAKPELVKNVLKWHCLDSKAFNVKLYRFATGLGLHPTEALFQAVTVVNCTEDIDVRLAAGSNSASVWWVNGEEVLLLSGDRRMVVDDCVSRLITLHKGKNIVRGFVINGPGMSDFCVRFLDADGQPVTDITISNK